MTPIQQLHALTDDGTVGGGTQVSFRDSDSYFKWLADRNK